MDLALEIVAQVVKITPGPFLQPAFASFVTIWGRIGQLKVNRRQMYTVARTAAQIILALHAHDPADVDLAACEEFEHTLAGIEALCSRMARRRFVRAFLDSAMDQNEIAQVHSRLTLSVHAFQIGAHVNMQEHARHVEAARRGDQAETDAALRELLEKQDALLDLIGEAPVTDCSETQQTIFHMLEDILAAMKTADGGVGHDSEDFKLVLSQLRKITADVTPVQLDPNPLIVLLQTGLTLDVLVAPLKWRMHKIVQIDLLALHLTREQSIEFAGGTVGSQAFVDHLAKCNDRPLQYAALEVFQQDKDLKHFFKQNFEFTPSENPNPILANLKPGMLAADLVPPLRYEIRRYAWKDIITQHLAPAFFIGPDACERFIDHITKGDDLPLQYATLEVFREDKRVAHYFIKESRSESS